MRFASGIISPTGLAFDYAHEVALEGDDPGSPHNGFDRTHFPMEPRQDLGVWHKDCEQICSSCYISQGHIAMLTNKRVVLPNLVSVFPQKLRHLYRGTLSEIVCLGLIGHSNDDNFWITQVRDSFAHSCGGSHRHGVVDSARG